MKQSTNICVGASRRQKILGAVALVGLFACGLMIGSVRYGSTGISTKRIAMTDEQCEKIADRIVNVVRGDWNVNSGKSPSEINENLRELNDVYTKNCAGRVVRAEQVKPAPKAEVKVEDTANKETCEVIEGIMLGRIFSESDFDQDIHRSNINVYQKLLTHGCPENSEKYQKLIQRENDILAALTNDSGAAPEEMKTCAEIESLLTRDMPDANYYFDNRKIRARIYANLSERGCPENKQKYVELTARELAVARALQDDGLGSNDVREFYEIYNRIGMDSDAQQFKNKFPREFTHESEMF